MRRDRGSLMVMLKSGNGLLGRVREKVFYSLCVCTRLLPATRKYAIVSCSRVQMVTSFGLGLSYRLS